MTSFRSCIGACSPPLDQRRSDVWSPMLTRTGMNPLVMRFLQATGRPATAIAWPLAFPFHPELVDILTNRWGSLSGFQRTRGALRTLAHTVKALSQRRSKALLIHPGDVTLADPGIRGEVLRFAGESYKAALNADIIRPDSMAPEEDRRRGGVGRRVRLGHRAGHNGVLELVRVRSGPGRISCADADRGWTSRAVPRAGRGRA